MFAINSNGFLSDFTVIDKIDFSKLDFINEPSLVASDNNNPFAVDGTLRLELSSPQETFGQEVFTKIFPEAVMSQAKKSIKASFAQSAYYSNYKINCNRLYA